MTSVWRATCPNAWTGGIILETACRRFVQQGGGARSRRNHPSMLPHWLVEIFTHPDPRGLLIIVGKTTMVYLFLVGGLRLLGKRELGQMNIYDLVLIIVLANAVQNAMVGDDNTLLGGIVAATTLLLLNRLLTLVMLKWPQLERAMVGQPL